MPAPLDITPTLQIGLDEIEITAMRAQGAGGQHVNKTSSAVQLRFDVAASSLPEDCKQRLLARRDQRMTSEGVLVIKAQQHRSQELNRQDALERLRALIAGVAEAPRLRRPTKPTASSRRERVENKMRQSRVKAMRSRPGDHD